MSEPTSSTTIQVRNPAIIAGLTPIVAILPSMVLNMSRNLSTVTKYWIIGISLFLCVALIVVFVSLGTRKVALTLRHDGITFGKRNFSLEDIEKITYQQRSRYLKIRTHPAWNSINVYLGKQDEAPELVKQVERWVKQTGVSYRVQ